MEKWTKKGKLWEPDPKKREIIRHPPDADLSWAYKMLGWEEE